LVRWRYSVRDPKVGGPAAVARLQEQAVLADGTKIEYALGVSVAGYRGLRTIAHGGSDAGYRSYVVWFPDQQLGVAVVSNLASFNTGNIANRVAAVFLEHEMTADTPRPASPPPPVERKFITVESSTLDRYEGYYRNPDMLLQGVMKDGKLSAAPAGATPLEPNHGSGEAFYAEQMRADLSHPA
jgi:hypothetical protein